jgi:hypothetical protein
MHWLAAPVAAQVAPGLWKHLPLLPEHLQELASLQLHTLTEPWQVQGLLAAQLPSSLLRCKTDPPGGSVPSVF